MIQPVSPPITAAQYLRKSDDQRYSIDNQKAAIKEYANSRGFAIVNSYSDPPEQAVLQPTARNW